jgi:tRNA(Ile)-lysidine synthetase-like protein
MSNNVLQAIEKHLVFNKKIYISYSGGKDSTALLYGIFLLKKKFNLQLQAVHFNHNEPFYSQDMAKFCQENCKNLSIPLIIEPIPVHLPSKQDIWKHYRTQFLLSLMKKDEIVLLGHHLQDNVETSLMHLLMRGSSIFGMLDIVELEAGKTFIRPFLKLLLSDIYRFIYDNHLAYYEDPSNSKTDYKRNFLRHNILPQLQSLHSNYLHNVEMTIEYLHNKEVLLNKYLAMIWNEEIQSRKICQEKLKKLPLTEQIIIIKYIINHITQYQLSKRQLFHIAECINKLKNWSYLLGKEDIIKIDKKIVFFQKRS